MSSDSQQVHDEVKWVTELYAAVDGRDLTLFDKYFIDDPIVNFGNLPTMDKKEDVVKQFKYLFDATEKLEHEIERVDSIDEQLHVRNLIKITLLGGTETSVKAFTVCYKAPGAVKADRLDIYGDFGEAFRLVGEVYAKAAEK